MKSREINMWKAMLKTHLTQAGNLRQLLITYQQQVMAAYHMLKSLTQ